MNAPANAAPPRLSVIIPALNEAAIIEATVAECLALRPAPEVIVVDGGSTDRTAELAACAGARVLRSPRRGRAHQMNAGAAAATGDVFVFLHADTRIPPVAWTELCARLEDLRIGFGAFRRRWQPPSRLLAVGSWLAVWRGRIGKIFLGDQGIFVRRALFESVGGYPPILLFEDVELCRRLRRVARGVMLGGAVVTSRRRFEAEGDLRRWARNVLLWLRYSFGSNPDALARIYYKDACNSAVAAAEERNPASAPPASESIPGEREGEE